MMPTPTNAIDGDIALFLGDAGSRHQAFSKRALTDYLATEGHDEQEILRALDDWSPLWSGDGRLEDEFRLDGDAWAKVESLKRTQRLQLGKPLAGPLSNASTIWASLTQPGEFL